MKDIYIYCPAQTATGGPELLHQLCSKLNFFGFNSYMYYFNKYIGDPTPNQYKKYNIKIVEKCEDKEESLIIVPETAINYLKLYKKAHKVIWWLSVDFYTDPLKSRKNMIKDKLGFNFNIKRKEVLHLVQSYYAENFLMRKKIDKDRIFYLSDYLNNVFIKKSTEFIANKKNYVLYNPKKGYEFTKKIIECAPNLQWRPLINLTPEEMADLMKESKVYIDFGNHPGKDRIPREAAINNCCIITGKRGAAKFKKDVNIEDEFKFEDKEENIQIIISKIKEILNNFDENLDKYKEYRNIIMEEETNFDKNLKEIFGKIAN